MAEYHEDAFVNSRKQKIFSACWLPVNDPTAILLFHHGLGEYTLRYKDKVFPSLVHEAGVAVYSHDFHGHGKSEPREEKGKAYIDRFEDLVDDASQFTDLVMAKHPGVPIIVAGHSLGGLVAVLLLARRQKDFAGLVLQSAAIDVEWTPLLKFQAVVGDCIATCCPFSKIVPAVRPQDMSEDPKVVQEYLDDPEIYQGSVKARSGNEILKGFRKAGKGPFQAQITVPIYACHGTSDRCTSLPAVKRLIENASSTDKVLKEIKGGYHEIMMGPQKSEVIASLVQWIKAHAMGGAKASGVQV